MNPDTTVYYKTVPISDKGPDKDGYGIVIDLTTGETWNYYYCEGEWYDSEEDARNNEHAESYDVENLHWLKPIPLSELLAAQPIQQGNVEVLKLLETINPQNSDGTDTKWYEYYGTQVIGQGKESFVHSGACYSACKMAEQELFKKITVTLSQSSPSVKGEEEGTETYQEVIKLVRRLESEYSSIYDSAAYIKTHFTITKK